MKRLEDLRFVIGLFFAIISVLLLGVGWTTPPIEPALRLNVWAGSLMGVFGLLMLGLTYFSPLHEE